MGGEGVLNVLAENVRRRRLKKGWIQAQLAVYAGTSPSLVWQLESGKREGMTLATLLKLARALDTTPSELLEGVS